MNSKMSISLKRDEAVQIIQEMLEAFGPQVKIEIQHTKDVITLRARSDPSELLQWAERIGDRYEDVFKRLAND